jgi:CRP/FNR family transcriptional regulator, dissimilatory nitrate respiration regulator
MSGRKSVQPDIPRLLATLSLFDCLHRGQIECLAQQTRERLLERGEMLFHKGDAAQGLFLVVYGQVKLAFLAANGNEKVIEVIGPKQCFGNVALLAECCQPLCAQAVTDTLLLQIPKDAIFDMLEEAPAFARRMLADLAAHTQKLLQDVETYTQQSSAQRVIGYLQQHCTEVDDPEDCIAITLPTSKQIIASRLSLTPATLSRIFHDLSEANLIAVQGKQITINSVKRLYEYELDS